MAPDRLHAAVTVPGEDFSRVALTAAAADLLRSLWLRHGPLEGKRFLIRSTLMGWPA